MEDIHNEQEFKRCPGRGICRKKPSGGSGRNCIIKNENNVLPFTKEDKISVFGRPQLEYYRSGTGSGGAVQVEYATNIIDGFRKSGLQLNETLAEDYVEWLKDHPFDNGGGGWAAEPWFQKDMDITAEYAKKQAEVSNKAVYIVGRTAGEDKDNYNGAGSYLLTEEEIANIKNITEAFEDVVVVLNVSNIIDMKWMNNPQFNGKIKAVVYVWSGGMEGGNAVADVLSGKETPSGKLPDTIAENLEDYPSADNFGNPLTNLYQEDIYVGYRYFETFAPEKVMFEFGYGISYTTFDMETVSAKETGGEIQLQVKVTNTGDRYSGKEVVQVYYSAPQGKLGKPVKELCAYAKTEKLAPKESQTVELSFAVKDMASYDDSNATGHKSCYVLEAGDYVIYVGNSVRNVKEVYTYSLEDLKVTEQLSEICCPDDENLTI